MTINLMDEIEAFLAETRMTASELGKNALGDTAFVGSMRGGRDPRLSTVDRVRTYMREYREEVE